MSNFRPSAAPEQSMVSLRLFIAGFNPLSQKAIDTLRALCEQHLDGRYQLEIIDIYQQPELARQNQIIATPTLVKYLPRPQKLMVGDFTRVNRFLVQLGIAS